MPLATSGVLGFARSFQEAISARSSEAEAFRDDLRSLRDALGASNPLQAPQRGGEFMGTWRGPWRPWAPSLETLGAIEYRGR